MDNILVITWILMVPPTISRELLYIKHVETSVLGVEIITKSKIYYVKRVTELIRTLH